VDLQTLWRAALLQAVILGIVFVILAVTLPHHFFDDWGWLTGPIAWLGSAAAVGQLLKLPLAQVLTGAVLAGLVSAVFVALSLHIVGTILAVPLFALWCARLRDDPELPAETI
jgi:hypothetical protein